MSRLLLGWSDYWAPFIQADDKIIRITAVHRGLFEASDGNTDFRCYLSGKLQHSTSSAGELPAVGDWCIVSSPFINEQNLPALLIQRVLPRRSKISRVAAGTVADEQIIAANVNYAFIVTSANRDLNINRLHRYVLLAEEGAVTPVVLLSKIDLCHDYCFQVEKIKQALPQVGVVCTSMQGQIITDELRSLLKPGTTSVFIGSSGVGKSTLVNHLLGKQIQATKMIREGDDRGRHATSARELFLIPNGGMIIDTPGLRELRVFGSEENVKATFKSVNELARECRFSDCSHAAEPGCAVQAAVVAGDIDAKEIENYQKLLREMEHKNRKMDKRFASNAKKRWKWISVAARNLRKR
ncbi:MAG: ribosome small subunit-dependent GTPase A [Deltaproteobacteria bacterium]|nr:ribosome small subunit-dependent GTPase A [Deltaproteobacteria bacterium]